jgi:hypothetical protein
MLSVSSTGYMERILKLLVIAFISATIFHLVSRTTSFVLVNWIFEEAVWPDQKSFSWTMKLGFGLAFWYLIAVSFSILILLRQKYSRLRLLVVFYAFILVSVALALISGWVLNTPLPSDPISYTLVMLSPLWVFLGHVFLLKALRNVYC